MILIPVFAFDDVTSLVFSGGDFWCGARSEVLLCRWREVGTNVRQCFWMWASTMSHLSLWISELGAPWRCYGAEHEYSGPRPWHIQPWIQKIFQSCGRRLVAEYLDTVLYYRATDEDAAENDSFSRPTVTELERLSIAELFIFQRSNSTRNPSTLFWTSFCCREVTFGYVVEQKGLNAMDALPSKFISLILETDRNLGDTLQSPSAIYRNLQDPATVPPAVICYLYWEVD